MNWTLSMLVDKWVGTEKITMSLQILKTRIKRNVWKSVKRVCASTLGTRRHLNTPSICLSQIHFVFSNLNPGLQGMAVTLNEYLFFSVENTSSSWKWCTVLFFISLYRVSFARRYVKGKDWFVTGDNKCMMLSKRSLGVPSDTPFSVKVAMVNIVWLSSS